MVDEKGIYKIISETMTDGLLELDLHGKIIHANPAALSMLGFTLQEITKKTHRDLTPAKWHQQESQAIQEVKLSQNKGVTLEQEYQRQNNTTFPVLLKPIMVTGPDQKPANILILCQDLTKQKEQEQLRQTHRRQLNSLSLIIRKLQENDTVDQTIQFVLEALVAAMKYPEVAVPLIAVEDETFSTNKYSDDLEYGLTTTLYVNGREAGEVTVYYRENKPFTLPDEQNILESIAQALGVWLAQKSAAQELSDFAEKYRSIFDALADGFALYEIKDEGRELIVADWNRAAEKMYNLLRHDVLGQDIKKFFPAMEKTDVYKAILECSRSGDTKTLPLVHYQDARRDQYLHTIIYQVGDKVAAIFRDVTEEEKVRQELTRSEQKFRSLIEGSADAIYLLSLAPGNPQYVDVNQSACQMLHYTRAELLSRGPAKIESPEDAALVPERVAKILNEGQTLFETEHMTKEGIPVSVEVNASVVEVGSQKYILSFARDITERKRLEAERDTILKNTMDGFYIVDEQGHILEVNNSYCSMIGYSRDELLKMSLKDIEAAETEEIIAQRIKRIIHLGFDRFETKHKCKDGRIIRIEASVNYVKDKIGKFYAFMRDITERRKAEEILAASEKKYRTMIETSNDLIWTLDKEGKFTYFNKKAEEISGYILQDWLGRSFAPLIPPEDMERLLYVLQEVLKGKPWHYETRVQKTDGTFLSLSVNTTPLYSEEGKIIGTISFGQDITERKQAEEIIKDERDRAQKYLDIVDVILLALNKEGRIALINKKGCEILGADESELIGKNWFDNFVSAAVRQEGKQTFNQLMRGDLKEVNNYENYIITKAGAEKHVAWHNTILIDSAGEIQGTLSSGEDITASKKVQEELRKRMSELERFNKVTMEREKRIIELKKKVKELEQGSHGQT